MKDPFLLYFRFVSASKWFIVLLWAAMIGIGAWRAPKLFNNLKDVLTPSHSAPSFIARQKFSEFGFGIQQTAVVLAQSLGDHDVLSDGYVERIFTQLGSQWGYYGAQSLFTINSTNSPLHEPIEMAIPMFLTDDHKSTIMAFSNIDWLVPYLQSSIDALHWKRDEYYIKASGPAALSHTDSTGAENDLAKMDAISIPIALLVLAWRVRSLPLMVIPLISLPISLLVAFSLLDAASSSIKFPSFAPALFISTSVALGFDWSLFMLTRFKEGIKLGKSPQDSVADSVVYAGHTVVLSGVTLVVAYLSLLLFKSDFVVAVGKGAVITMCSCLLVNITFTPALLLCFPRFFKWDCSCTCRRRSPAISRDSKSPTTAPLLDNDGTPHYLDASTFEEPGTPERASEMVGFMPPSKLPDADVAIASQHSAEYNHVDKSGYWYKHALFVTGRPWLSLALVLLLGSPLTIMCYKFKVTTDQNQIHPRNTEVFSAWNRYTSTFPAGMSSPLALITVVGNATDLNTVNTAINITNGLIQELSAAGSVPADLFSGPSWIDGQPVTLQRALDLLLGDEANTELGIYARFRNLMFSHVNVEENPFGLRAFYTEIDVPWDPQGPKADDFITTTRKLMESHAKAGVAEFYLAFGMCDMYDVMDEVYDVFILALLGTVIALLLVIGVAFRSVATALRLAFSIVVTLSWCYGSGVIVFTTPLFKWTNAGMKATEALSWLGPVLTFSLVIGLCVDYDVFLTSRIMEYRSKGMSDVDAVVYGFAQTAGVITSAGVIMVIAFGSMMLSSQMLLVEAGFFLSFSIFLDTFIIRTVLCPALMVIFGRFHWWPRKMPQPAPEPPVHAF